MTDIQLSQYIDAHNRQVELINSLRKQIETMKTNKKKIKKNNDFNIDYEMYDFLTLHNTHGVLFALKQFRNHLIKDLESAKNQEPLTEDFKHGWIAALMHIIDNLDRMEYNVDNTVPSHLLKDDQFDILFKKFQEAFPHKSN